MSPPAHPVASSVPEGLKARQRAGWPGGGFNTSSQCSGKPTSSDASAMQSEGHGGGSFVLIGTSFETTPLDVHPSVPEVLRERTKEVCGDSHAGVSHADSLPRPEWIWNEMESIWLVAASSHAHSFTGRSPDHRLNQAFARAWHPGPSVMQSANPFHSQKPSQPSPRPPVPSILRPQWSLF